MREKERDKDRERDHKSRTEIEKEKDVENRRELQKDMDRERDTEKERRKERDRDRDRKEREWEKEKDREGERDRVRDERERDRGRDQDQDRDRETKKEKEKFRERERDRDKKKERDQERDRDRNRERERERERDGRDYQRARQKGKEHESEKEAEKAKDRSRESDLKEKEKGKDEDRTPKEQDKSQNSTRGLEERVAKMKDDRIRSLERRKVTEKGDEENEIVSWVNKSRKLEEQTKANEKKKASRMARTLAEQEFEEDNSDEEYNTKNLAGLKIRHGLDKVMEGGAIVLTLKDQNILEGDDINEEVDELENIELAEQQAREAAYRAAKKKPGVYDDDDFSAPHTILPQADDVLKDDGVTLDETGGIDEESKKRLDEIRRRLQKASMGERAQDLVASEATRLTTDYYTQEEMLQFKKPKKKKKLRKKTGIDIDALEAEAKAAGLGAVDLGSRASAGRSSARKIEERAVEDSKKNAYQNAYTKALEASKLLRPQSNASMDMDLDEPVFGADDDDELYRSLERARLAALKKQSVNGGTVAGPQAVAARLAALKEEVGSGSQQQGVFEGESEKPLVITDTGEFCLSLQLDEVISRRAGAKDVFGEEEDVGPAARKVSEDSSKEGGWIEVKEADHKDSSDEEEEPETILEESIKDISVGKGLAGALHLLKERGTLKETVDWGGRNMDKKRSKLVGIIEENPEQTRQRDILLDRVDEFGRTMTPKEAFRRLSHKFHGKGPGKMKIEKKMKQYQEELKLKQMNSGDTPLMSMEKMRDAQEKMHTPYIVISGHIKPGQTSDPRSGFATVEKEPIGSLTPMLGDKKVEHFLGIKRKPDTGSMGPPPPKKPKSER